MDRQAPPPAPRLTRLRRGLLAVEVTIPLTGARVAASMEPADVAHVLGRLIDRVRATERRSAHAGIAAVHRAERERLQQLKALLGGGDGGDDPGPAAA